MGIPSGESSFPITASGVAFPHHWKNVGRCDQINENRSEESVTIDHCGGTDI